MTDLLTWSRSVGRAAGTIRNIAGKGAHVVRILGAGLPVARLAMRDGVTLVERYVTARRDEGAKLSTVAAEVSILCAALRRAQRTGGFAGDVRAVVPGELRGAHVPRSRWLTEAEVAELTTALQPEWREHLLAYLTLGVRRMELFAPTDADVDINTWRLHVRGTKTRKADRWLPIHPALRPAIERRMSERAGWPLFEPWPSVLHHLHRAGKRAGLGVVTVTDLRRTFASTLLNAGASTSVVRELLGHTTSRQVDRVYGQISSDAMRAAVSALPFGGKQGGSRNVRRGSTRGTHGTRIAAERRGVR